MDRKQRANTGRDTVEILAQGWYAGPEGTRVDFTDLLRKSVERTRVIRPADWAAIAAPAGGVEDALVEVTGETTLAAVRRLVDEGGTRVGALNFASAKNPGGGFLSGSQAQEESLARCSGLYSTLLAAPEYYAANRKSANALYTDHAIYSPEVPVFRTDDGRLLPRPYLSTFITMPAVNRGALPKNFQHPDEVAAVMKRRMRMVLTLAATNGVRELVLGAWGCGVFRNDPAQIARLFADCLTGEGSFRPCFKRIVFAVFDPTAEQCNRKPFEDQLGSAGDEKMLTAEEPTVNDPGEFYFFWGGWPSQWHRSDFVIDGTRYGCCEQYMMAEKARTFGDTDALAAVLKTPDPRKQKALGRTVRGFDPAVWEGVCREVVFRGNLAKFRQSPALADLLLSTGKRTIVEASPTDRIWGIGLAATDPRASDRSQWRGTNWLGEAVMRVRDVLLADRAQRRVSSTIGGDHV